MNQEIRKSEAEAILKRLSEAKTKNSTFQQKYFVGKRSNNKRKIKFAQELNRLMLGKAF